MARQIGVDQPNISQLGTPKRPGISKELIIKIVKRYTDVNPWWLLTGEGEMLMMINDKKNDTDVLEEDSPDYVADPLNGLRMILNKYEERITALEEAMAHKDDLLKELMNKMGALLQNGGVGEGK